MILIWSIIIFIGVLLIGFGYKIKFEGKTHLINNYNNKKLKDKKAYANWIGSIELIIGIMMVILGLMGFIIRSVKIIMSLHLGLTIILIILLIVGEIRYSK